MNDTPRTDALREVVIGQYKEDELTGNGMGNILSALTDIETLERERDAERALADRLAEALKELLYYDLQDVNLGRLKSSRDSLAAWKESRQDRNHS